MLGFSFSEVVLIGIVALVAVGPQRLPGMLKTFGLWMRKLRKLTTEVRAQTGIDDILRAEGIQGGITELRSLMRGQAPAPAAPYRPFDDPYRSVEVDLSREYPPEGPDAKGALPDDLTAQDDEEDDAPVITVTADHTPPEIAPPAAVSPSPSDPPAPTPADPPPAEPADPPPVLPADPPPAGPADPPPALPADPPPTGPADPPPPAPASTPDAPSGKPGPEIQT